MASRAPVQAPLVQLAQKPIVQAGLNVDAFVGERAHDTRQVARFLNLHGRMLAEFQIRTRLTDRIAHVIRDGAALADDRAQAGLYIVRDNDLSKFNRPESRSAAMRLKCSSENFELGTGAGGTSLGFFRLADTILQILLVRC